MCMLCTTHDSTSNIRRNMWQCFMAEKFLFQCNLSDGYERNVKKIIIVISKSQYWLCDNATYIDTSERWK